MLGGLLGPIQVKKVKGLISLYDLLFGDPFTAEFFREHGNPIRDEFLLVSNAAQIAITCEPPANLPRLLYVGELATAIETEGCYGWDRFRRLTWSGKDGKGGESERIRERALENLALAPSMFDHPPCTNLQLYFDHSYRYHSLSEYGWVLDKLPKFVGLEPEVPQRGIRSQHDNIPSSILTCFVELVNRNLDWNFDLDWLFSAAGFPEFKSERAEVERLHGEIQNRSPNKSITEETVKKLLKQHGRLEGLAPELQGSEMRGQSANTQSSLLICLVELANIRLDWDFNLDWLFSAAGFPHFKNGKKEIKRFYCEIQSFSKNKSLKPEPVEKFLEQLGRLHPS